MRAKRKEKKDVRTETHKITQEPELPGEKPRAHGALTCNSTLGTRVNFKVNLSQSTWISRPFAQTS
jgi:hypothetical protein